MNPVKALLASMMLVVAAGAPGKALGGDYVPDPEEIAAYARDVGVSTERAEEIFALQAQAGDLPGELQRSMGGDYAGMYFDHRRIRFVLPTTTGTIDASAQRSLQQRALTANVTVKRVKYTWAQLEAAQETLNQIILPLLQTQTAQTSLDPVKNAVVVRLSTAVSSAERLIVLDAKHASNVKVIIKSTDPDALRVTTTACSFPNCDRPLRGGVEIDNDLGWRCSAGLPVVKPDDSGTLRRFLLTAGHCTDQTNGSMWHAYQQDGTDRPIGSISQTHVGNAGDLGLIRVTSSYWGKGHWQPLVSVWGQNEEYEIDGRGSSYVGLAICRTGATSGRHCGNVLSTGNTLCYKDNRTLCPSNMTASNACASPGDSGGPYVKGHLAYGILGGGTQWCGGANTISFYSELTRGESAMNFLSAFPAMDDPDDVTTSPDDHDWKADVFKVNFAGSTDSMRTEVHVLSGASAFTQSIGDYATPESLQTAGTVQYLFGRWDGDSLPDLFKVVFAGSTGSGRTEVHILSGASNFTQYLGNFATSDRLQTSGQVQYALANWDGDGYPDLLKVQFAGSTGSGRTEVHLLSGASSFRQSIGDYATSDHFETPGTVQYLMTYWDNDGRPDLVKVNFAGATGSGRTEVHVLSGASGFTQSIGDYATSDHFETPGTVEYFMSNWDRDASPDLFKVNFAGATGSGRTEVHVLSGASSFTQSIGDYATSDHFETPGTVNYGSWDGQCEAGEWVCYWGNNCDVCSADYRLPPVRECYIDCCDRRVWLEVQLPDLTGHYCSVLGNPALDPTPVCSGLGGIRYRIWGSQIIQGPYC